MRKLKGRILLLVLFISLSFSAFTQKDGYYNNLDSALKTPDNVRILDLKKKRLKEFPIEILKLNNLEKLILSRNSISFVPCEITNLKKLKYLDLSSNNIDALPNEMSLMKIDSLILWDNPIRKFPREFSKIGLLYLDLRAIQMNKEEQEVIKSIFPYTKIRMDNPCYCNPR